jgi:hypothetical protein
VKHVDSSDSSSSLPLLPPPPVLVACGMTLVAVGLVLAHLVVVVVLLLFVSVHIIKFLCLYFDCRPFYGFHTKEHQYFKIYFYNPLMVKKATELLQVI